MTKPAYMIIAIDIDDEEVLASYRDAAMPMLDAAGATVLAASDEFELADGTWPRRRIVILEFPSLGAASAFWNAPEYQPLKALRESASTQDCVLVEGLFEAGDAAVPSDSPPHYLVGAATVSDPGWVEEYMQKVPPISAAFGVQALASGSEFTVLDGSWPRDGLVVLRFPSEQVYRDFWYGEAYRPMKELREANSEGDHIAFAGLPG